MTLEMTTIIISPPDVAWVEPTTDILRQHGAKVVRLGTLSIIGFLLASERISAVVVHEDCIPAEWDVMRARMTRLAPNCRIVIVPRDDRRSPADLASLVHSP